MNKETICAVVRDLMPSYLDKITEGATNAFIEQHLTECEACRTVKRNMMKITSPAEQAQAEFLDRLRRARVRRVRRGWAAAIAVLVVLAFSFLPLPRSVDMRVEAIRWRSGHEELGAEPVGVVIRGTYYDYLFRDDTFLGDIMIDGVGITQRTEALTEVRFDQTGYLVYSDDQHMLNSMGFIVGSPGLGEFVIGLYDKESVDGVGHGSWQGSDGTVLTWPAQTREEAVENTKRILTEQKCTWLTRSVWEAGMTREEYDALKGK